ncbi:hypothetical protein M2069_28720, partial [Klebsiella pneumoniae]|nr:hypothetical protein [Klebsiella pneumoniae]MDZ1988136.1 hypothetical protein [Klebsiella pneumoniae]
AGKKSAQIREILISESAWEEMTCLFAPSLSGTVLLTSVLLKRPEHLDPGRNKSGRFAKKRPLLLPLTVTLHDTREARC